ncbi:MAG: alpha-1,2-fucosyltransferase [Lachnospiraceae bacterium]|nr:alpha-1,2-fucosyltransferase [Lachnospiraceae bacterium]
MKVSDKFESILKTIVWWCKPLIEKCIRNPAVIFRMDGGTCSQIVDYVSFKILAEKTGCNMLMDITWYDRYGEGKESILARPYNIDKLFELEEYRTAGKVQAWLYKVLFSYFPSDDMITKGFGVNLGTFKMPDAPCYLQGYYKYELAEIERNIGKYCSLKDKQDILDPDNMVIYEEIASCGNPIGVHVRRGDMSVEGGYWEVLPNKYFINVCEDLNKRDSVFYFFSEEPQWILDQIIPYINIQYRIVYNTAFDGYKDLYLLSRCKYQVKSQGSFGEYAYILNSREDKNMVVYDKDNPRLWKWSSKL